VRYVIAKALAGAGRFDEALAIADGHEARHAACYIRVVIAYELANTGQTDRALAIAEEMPDKPDKRRDAILAIARALAQAPRPGDRAPFVALLALAATLPATNGRDALLGDIAVGLARASL